MKAEQRKAMLLVMEPDDVTPDGMARKGEKPSGKEAKLECPKCGYEGPKEKFKPTEG